MDNTIQKIDEKANIELAKYISSVKSFYPVDDAYLFGSQARGTATKHSDYDVAIVSDAATNRHEFLVKLLGLSRNIALPIEPHPMTKEDLNDSTYLLGQEVKKYGIVLG